MIKLRGKRGRLEVETSRGRGEEKECQLALLTICTISFPLFSPLLLSVLYFLFLCPAPPPFSPGVSAWYGIYYYLPIWPGL